MEPLWLIAIPTAGFTLLWVGELVLDLTAPLWCRRDLTAKPTHQRG